MKTKEGRLEEERRGKWKKEGRKQKRDREIILQTGLSGKVEQIGRWRQKKQRRETYVKARCFVMTLLHSDVHVTILLHSYSFTLKHLFLEVWGDLQVSGS